jgi:hypothetical protein
MTLKRFAAAGPTLTVSALSAPRKRLSPGVRADLPTDHRPIPGTSSWGGAGFSPGGGRTIRALVEHGAAAPRCCQQGCGAGQIGALMLRRVALARRLPGAPDRSQPGCRRGYRPVAPASPPIPSTFG